MEVTACTDGWVESLGALLGESADICPWRAFRVNDRADAIWALGAPNTKYLS